MKMSFFGDDDPLRRDGWQEATMSTDESRLLTYRRHLVARYGRFRVDREMQRIRGQPWRDSGFHHLVLEVTPDTEFDVGAQRPQIFDSLPRVMRFVRYWLHNEARFLEGSGITSWLWHPHRVADDNHDDAAVPDARAPLPDWRRVTNREQFHLVTEALVEVEREHPEVVSDPDDDYVFPDPELAYQVEAYRSYYEEWRTLHGAWPSPSDVAPGPLLARYGSFRVHGVEIGGRRLWAPGRDRQSTHLVVFDADTLGTRLLCTKSKRTQLLPHSEWGWVERYVAMWLRMVESNIEMGRKVLTETTDPAVRREIEQGLALREQWHMSVRDALRQEREVQHDGQQL